MGIHFEIAKIVLDKLKLEQNPETVLALWFHNYHSGSNHLKLTFEGVKNLRRIFKIYEINLKKSGQSLTSKQILLLNQNTQCPYYVSKKQDKIIFFDFEDAFDMIMIDGDIDIFTELKD